MQHTQQFCSDQNAIGQISRFFKCPIRKTQILRQIFNQIESKMFGGKNVEVLLPQVIAPSNR